MSTRDTYIADHFGAPRAVEIADRAGRTPPREPEVFRHVAARGGQTMPNLARARVLTPSAELAAVVGPEPLPRSDMVKRVWSYIKAHDLQDPTDRRIIISDDKLRAVCDRPPLGGPV